MNDRIFEWDEEKDEINRRKHGVGFDEAALVFDDENRIERYDTAHSIDEDRWITIGRVRSILFVVYTERSKSTRLISARKATKEERTEYYGHGAQSNP